MSGNIVVLADLSHWELPPDDANALLEHLECPGSLRSHAVQGASVLPLASDISGVPTEPSWHRFCAQDRQAAWLEAFGLAGQGRHSLLVLLAPLLPGPDAIGGLLQAAIEDPMIPVAHARIGRHVPDEVLSIDESGSAWVSRSLLAGLPNEYIRTEYLSPCFLIESRLLQIMGPPALTAGMDPEGQLLTYLSAARRAGFRHVQTNRVVVPLAEPKESAVELPLRGFHEIEPELPRPESATLAEVDRREERNFERLLVSALSSNASSPLLFDVTNLAPAFNGTAQVILALLDAIRSLTGAAPFALWAREDACQYHDIAARYPHWRISTGTTPPRATVAVRLSQPWSPAQLLALHGCALFNVYLMLDTIAWDIGYLGPSPIDSVWRTIARSADGIAFISRFSEARFRKRFRTDTRTCTCLLSCNPVEFRHPSQVPPFEEGNGIFVVGNDYKHKQVAETASLLRRSFPCEEIITLGGTDGAASAWRSISSGQTPEAVIHSVYRSARVVVFPSVYEGFGFPIVTAMAYGRSIVARRSSILREIGGRYIGPGSLFGYESAQELVETVGRILHSRPLDSEPLGFELSPGSEAWSWKDTARTLMSFCREVSEGPYASRWADRARLLAILDHPVAERLSADTESL